MKEYSQQLLRVKDVALLLGIGVSTIWNYVRHDNSFPKPFKLSPRITVWKYSDVINWISNQSSNRD